MSPIQLSVDKEPLQGLLTNEQALRQLIEQVLNQVLQAEVTDHLQAEPYERTEQRQRYRNGVRPRQLTTRVGS